MQFFEELPAQRGAVRRSRVDWAKAKEDLVAHEGQWGLMAENVASSAPHQLRRGDNKHFRGDDLNHFEFSVRKPIAPEVPYGDRRTDLYGRYSKESIN